MLSVFSTGGNGTTIVTAAPANDVTHRQRPASRQRPAGDARHWRAIPRDCALIVVREARRDLNDIWFLSPEASAPPGLRFSSLDLLGPFSHIEISDARLTKSR